MKNLRVKKFTRNDTMTSTMAAKEVVTPTKRMSRLWTTSATAVAAAAAPKKNANSAYHANLPGRNTNARFISQQKTFAMVNPTAVATAAGFSVANVFCWLMNRAFVFRPGKFAWHVEFALFYGAAALATVIALVVQSALIRFAGTTTSFAAILEIVVSFFVNFVTRRFFIFKG